jgi:hypothetical protein
MKFRQHLRIVLAWAVAVGMMAFGIASLELPCAKLLALAFTVLSMTLGLYSGLRRMDVGPRVDVP